MSVLHLCGLHRLSVLQCGPLFWVQTSAISHTSLVIQRQERWRHSACLPALLQALLRHYSYRIGPDVRKGFVNKDLLS